MSSFTWIVAALILAAILDLGLMVVLRRAWRAGRAAPVEPVAEQTESIPTPRQRWVHSRWLEWGILLLAVTLYCAGILDLGAPTRLPGNESEIFQMLDQVLVNSLLDFGKFPLWNPYIQTGAPFIADPMLHVYNPVVTLPVLLWGVQAGFKLGIYFSFLIAALGMWKLADTLGMGRAARLWTALMFTFAGQPAARFFQGQYLFVLGFAYIPWIIHHLLRISSAISTPADERAKSIPFGGPWLKPALQAVLALALLFFSGNAYYPLYVLLAIALLMLVLLPNFQRRPPFIKLNLRLLNSYLFVGVLAVGLIAIQLLPTAEFWPRLNKDTNLAGSQSLAQIYLDYTSKDSYRPDAYSVLPAREEFYAYIGVTPFMALSLLPLALWQRPRRPQVFFLLLLGLTVVWISLEAMPWYSAFLNTRLFIQFRHLLRILIIGGFALITLAGLGLDTLWKIFSRALAQLKQNTPQISPRSQKLLRFSLLAGLVLLGVFMSAGLLDVFNTNQIILRTQPVYQPAFNVLRWVRQNDLTDSYVRHTPTNAWHAAMIANRLRFIEVWYHFADIRSIDLRINQRWVQALPNYIVQTEAEPVPEGAQLIQVIEGYNVYRLPESLPMAFLVARDQLAQSSDQWLQASQVTPLTTFFASTSRVELIADTQGDQVLTLLVTHYPGWKVEVDGTEQPLLNVGGYLAVNALNGVHKYTFSYQPYTFYLGLGITLVSTAILGYFLSRELGWNRQSLRQRGGAALSILRQGQARLGGWWRRQQPLTASAVYQAGVLHLEQPLELPENSPLRVTVEAQAVHRSPLREALRGWWLASAGMVSAIWKAIPLPTALFTVGLVVYLLTRLIGLTDWPIYFFTDEAVQTVMAEDFVHGGLRNYTGEFLPTYFNKDATYNLSSLSVYLQVIPYLLFGKSVFVTRAVSVLVSAFGALMVGLTLRDIFKVRYWWSGVLLLSIAPAWFLHSRTAFETVEMTAFYAAFLYFYLRYRYLNPKALYASLVFGALVFYTYSPGQLIIVVSGLFLLLSDLRYHWQQRKVALRGLVLLLALALPYLRHYLAHPEATLQHLSTRAPFWLEDIPFTVKLQRYLSEYLSGLDPRYWFWPNSADLERHLMQGYGHLHRWTLPFYLLGLGIGLVKSRASGHRAVLLALLAAPVGSALVEVGVTRLLVLLIPVTLLTGLGLSQALEWLVQLAGWLVKRLHRGEAPKAAALLRTHSILALLLVTVLCGVNFAMLRDARFNGPLWYQDYTLSGMQYGARQLFAAVIDYYEAHPGVQMLVSPSWTNGADAVAEFFLPPGAPVGLGSVEGHIFQHLPLNDQMVFVAIPNEMDKVLSSGKFAAVQVDQVLNYPNGEPGFYFIRLRYVDNIDTILEAERESRRTLLETTLRIDDQDVLVRYSRVDMGEISMAFDGNLNTLTRTLEANPFVIELTFPQARPVSGASLVVGSARMQVTAHVTVSGLAEPLVFETDFTGSVSQPALDLGFGETLLAESIRFELLVPGIAEPTNVHVWEITLQD